MLCFAGTAECVKCVGYASQHTGGRDLHRLQRGRRGETFFRFPALGGRALCAEKSIAVSVPRQAERSAAGALFGRAENAGQKVRKKTLIAEQTLRKCVF